MDSLREIKNGTSSAGRRVNLKDAVPAEGGSIRRNGYGADYKIDHDTGCWVWQKSILPNGYPSGAAYRWYWMVANGVTKVPAGHQVHHLCRNTACVNPEHLELLPKRRHLELHYLDEKAGLTFEDVRKIRELGKRRDVNGRQVAEMFGVSWFTVYRYWRGESWEPEGHGGRVELDPIKCARPGCTNPVPGRRRDAKWCSRYCASTSWRNNNRDLYNRRAREARAKAKECKQ